MVPSPRPDAPIPSRRERFLAGYVWLALKNVMGWSLVLAALVAGPLVPGPGGIPLFLIGFALVDFPGKRRLTARVLRGKPVRLRSRGCALGLVGVSLVLGVGAVFGSHWWIPWPDSLQALHPWAVLPLALAASGLAWVLLSLTLQLLNVLLRSIPRIRRPVRHWLRRRRLHLLPPRWRRRLPHEHGRGPHRLKEEILKLGRPRWTGTSTKGRDGASPVA